MRYILGVSSALISKTTRHGRSFAPSPSCPAQIDASNRLCQSDAAHEPSTELP
jgi:hypothetical protein